MSKEEVKKNYELFLANCNKFKPIKESEVSNFYYKLDWTDKKIKCEILSWEGEYKDGMFCNVKLETGKIANKGFIKFGEDTVVGGIIQ